MAMTPTEWYTSLPGVGSVGPPGDRRPGGGGGGGAGGRGSPLMSQFQKRRRELQNLLAEQQLELMKEKLKQARSKTLTDRSEYALAPFREAEARRNMPRPPRKAPEGGDYGQVAKSFFDLYGGVRKPFDVRNMAKWLEFIGPKAAHAGMMQTGRLFSQQGAGGVVTGPEEERTPVGQSGSPGERAWQNPPGLLPPGVPMRSRPFGGLTAAPPGREKGGTIPETGPYELHEGEVVVSADQVDRPLMAALKADKLSKMSSGQMDGKGTGPGVPTSKSMVKDEFRGGTLHSYQAGSVEEDESLREEYLRRRMEEMQAAWGRERSNLENQWVNEETPEQRAAAEDYYASTGGFGPELERAGGGSPGGGSQFGGLGELAQLVKSKMNVRGPSPANWFDVGRPEEGGRAPGPGELMEMLGGGAEAEPLPMGRDTSLAPMVGPQEDLERAGGMINERTIDRARRWREGGGQGPLGSAEDPLTMVASGPADPDSWTEQMKDPELREADREKTMAALNTQKADRLHNYLMQNAGDMDPQTFKAIQDQANQLKTINKSERDRQTLIDESAKDRIVEMDKSLDTYKGRLAQAEATGQASQKVGLRQQERDLRGKLERYEFKYLEEVENGASMDTLEMYVASMFEIKAALEGVSPGNEGYDEGRDAHMNYWLSVAEGR